VGSCFFVCPPEGGAYQLQLLTVIFFPFLASVFPLLLGAGPLGPRLFLESGPRPLVPRASPVFVQSKNLRFVVVDSTDSCDCETYIYVVDNVQL
jgi:hypothetical protein